MEIFTVLDWPGFKNCPKHEDLIFTRHKNKRKYQENYDAHPRYFDYLLNFRKMLPPLYGQMGAH